LGTGNARSITVVEAKDRTRLIVNMIQLQGYETEVQGNDLVLVLGVDSNAAAQTAVASEGAAAPASATLDVRTVDFRRGSQGEGQINISLSSPSVPVDVREEGG